MIARVLVGLWACYAVAGLDPTSGRVAELDAAEEQGLIASDTMTMDGVRQQAAAMVQRRQRARLRGAQATKPAESLQYASIKAAAMEETKMAKLRKHLRLREAASASERLTKKEQVREAQLIKPMAANRDLGAAAIYSKAKKGSRLKSLKAQVKVMQSRSAREDASMSRSAEEFKERKHKDRLKQLKPLLPLAKKLYPKTLKHLAKLAEQSKKAMRKAERTGNADQAEDKIIKQMKYKQHEGRLRERQVDHREITAKQKVSVLRARLLVRAAQKRETADTRQDKTYSELRDKASRKRDAARDEGKRMDQLAASQAKAKDLPTLKQARDSLRPGLQPCSEIDRLNGDALCSQPGST